MENYNIYQQNMESPVLIDEVSSTEYYVGQSNNTNQRGKATWRIKRIWKVGSVWNFGFPDGNQSFTYIWDSRDTYTYS